MIESDILATDGPTPEAHRYLLVLCREGLGSLNPEP